MPEQPSGEGDGCRDRFHGPRWHIYDQPGAVTGSDAGQVPAEMVDMPVVLVGRAGLKGVEGLFDKAAQILSEVGT